MSSLDGAGDVLDRHVGVHSVLVQHVDVVGAEVAQAVLGDLEDVLGPAVGATRPGLAQIEAELGRETISSRKPRPP